MDMPTPPLKEVGKKGRGKKATSDQLMSMLNFIQKDENLRSSKGTPDVMKVAWEALAQHVNAVGGAVKTADAWKKAYIEWKSHIRMKLRKGETLAELEKKCAKLAALNTVALGVAKVMEKGFEIQPQLQSETAKHEVQIIGEGEMGGEEAEQEWIDLQEIEVVTDEQIVVNESMHFEEGLEKHGNTPLNELDSSTPETVAKSKKNKQRVRLTPGQMMVGHTDATKSGFVKIAGALNAIATAINNLAIAFSANKS